MLLLFFFGFLKCRWLLLEMNKESEYFAYDAASKKHQFNGEIWMYSTKIPCGDCAIDELRALQLHDCEDALFAAEDTSSVDAKCCAFCHTKDLPLLRGHASLHLSGHRRTKPGRADAPFAPSMSCSDKIAKWIHAPNCGVESKLLAGAFEAPLRISKLFIEHRRPQCAAAIERGLFGRFGKQSPASFIEIIAIENDANNNFAADDALNASEEDAFACYWAIYAPKGTALDGRFFPIEQEHLVKGMRRGASFKASLNPKCWSKVSPAMLQKLRASV